MNNSDELYRELKPDIFSLSDPLFEVTQGFVRNQDDFLPHGAVLTASGDIRMVMAGPPEAEKRLVSAPEVLPVLHVALRAAARAENLRAIAVCESVTIVRDGGKKSLAIKVLIEHKRGLCTALYLPYNRGWLGTCTFGDAFAKPATPEVCPWG